jgi:hypothetical protein
MKKVYDRLWDFLKHRLDIRKGRMPVFNLQPDKPLRDELCRRR